MKAYLLIICTAFLLLSSCRREEEPKDFPSPIAEFDAGLKEEREVVFFNFSENAVSYWWDFGDGDTSVAANPSHRYAAVGTYEIRLIAFGRETGEQSEKQMTIIVENIGPPEACFELSSQTLTPGEELELKNCSRYAWRFKWVFGDGRTSSLLNPTHIYEEAGDYQIKLIAFNADATKSDTIVRDLKVGDRYLTGFIVEEFPSAKADGEAWDPELPFPLPIPGVGPAPDVKIRYKRDFDRSFNETDPVYDLDRSSLPQEYILRNGIKMAEDYWQFQLSDDDAVFGNELMSEFGGNIHEQGANGRIELAGTNARLVILYEIR